MASILLIDDDNDLRMIIAETLRRAGYTVDDTPSGKTGLTLYRAGRHDLIITDISMPEMDGLELVMALRQVVPEPRIIAISGDSQFSEALFLPAAEQIGAQRTLAKPFALDVLLQTVSEVLAGPAPAPVARPTPDAAAGPGAARGTHEPPPGTPPVQPRPKQ